MPNDEVQTDDEVKTNAKIWADALFECVHDYVAPAFKTLDTRIQMQAKRIAELERAPFKYDGPHETDKVYDKGTFVTHAGSIWHCNYKTASRPGDGQAWTLACKHGRDAR